MDQDRALELLQRSTRLEAQLVAESLASVPKRLQCIGLAPRSVEREHELASQPLLIRVRVDQRLQLGDELMRAAECELCVDAVHDGVQAQLLEPPDLRLREVELREVGQRRSAPERKRVPELFCGARRVAAVESLVRSEPQPLEAAQVELVGFDVEPVARRLGDERIPVRAVAVAEGAPQPRDRLLERVRGSARCLLAEEVVDQPVARDDLARVEQEDREQSALTKADERDDPAPTAHLERSENRKLEPT